MNYHNITTVDMVNGTGIRVVLWTAGCTHACPGCHNKQTWDKCSGILFDEEAKEELFRELAKDYHTGITFSGGDPLAPFNREVVGSLMKEIKEKFPDKDIWVYTGFTWEAIKGLDLMQYIDTLVDGRFVMELSKPSPRWRGSTNQRVIDVQASLRENKVVLSEENQK